MCSEKGLLQSDRTWKGQGKKKEEPVFVYQSGGLLLLHIPHSCHEHTGHRVLQRSDPSTAPVGERSSSEARRHTVSLGGMSCPPLKSFTLAGFVFKRKKPLPEPFTWISLLSRSGWPMPLFSRRALVRSPAAPTAASCDWCWVGRSQGPNFQLWSLGDSGIKREGGRPEV